MRGLLSPDENSRISVDFLSVTFVTLDFGAEFDDVSTAVIFVIRNSQLLVVVLTVP